MRREPRAQFVAEMRARFHDFVEVRFNELVARWEFVFLSAANRPCSQFLCWTVNPLTGKPTEPDPVTGMYPYRELTPEAERYVIENCERTFIGNRHDGKGGWLRHTLATMRYNRDLHAQRKRQKAEDYAYLIQQMDIRRPGWLKDHQRGPRRHFVPKPSAQRGVRDIETRSQTIELVSGFRTRKEKRSA